MIIVVLLFTQPPIIKGLVEELRTHPYPPRQMGKYMDHFTLLGHGRKRLSRQMEGVWETWLRHAGQHTKTDGCPLPTGVISPIFITRGKKSITFLLPAVC